MSAESLKRILVAVAAAAGVITVSASQASESSAVGAAEVATIESSVAESARTPASTEGHPALIIATSTLALEDAILRSSTGGLSRLSDFVAHLWGWPGIATMIIVGALIALAVLYHDRRSFRAASVGLLREAEAIELDEQKVDSRR